MKNNKMPSVCINHPEERMILLEGEKSAASTHVLFLVKSSESDPINYSLEKEATGIRVYA